MSMPNKILVTGNLGYIGPVVCEALRSAYPRSHIVGFDAGFFSNCLSGDSNPDRFLNIQHFGDVRDVTPDLFRDVDSVIHLAAVSNDPMGAEFEKQTEEINFQATVRCAELARDSGVKNFVFASSCSVYGTSQNGQICDENSQTSPLTAYARTKLKSEVALSKLVNPSFKVGCLRFGTAYGWSPRVRLDLVLNDFVARALTLNEIRILSDGTPWRPLVHVSDMAKAFIFMAEYLGGVSAEQFVAINVGDRSCNYRIRELGELVKDLIGNCKVEINKKATEDKRSYAVSFDRYAELNPHHKFKNINDGIIEFVDGVRGLPTFGKLSSNGEFVRLAVLRRLRDQLRLSESLRWSHAVEN